MVVMVSGPDNQAAGIGTVNKTDSAVVLEEQIVGYLSDGRAAGVTVSPYGQQQLMLGRSEAGGTGLALTPAFEVTEAGPKGQQSGVGLVGQSHSCHDIIVIRCI
jgi:hypothetical protein